MKQIFVGPNGIRAGWRFLIFLGIVFTLAWGTSLILRPPLVPQGWFSHWAPQPFLIAESVGGLGIVLTGIAAWIMARIERRPWSEYGLGFRRGWVGGLFEGLLWGLVSVSLLVLLIALSGGVTISGFALHGAELAKYALLWGAAMLVLGLAEEFLFRGYPQYTLATGIGFWPAAIVLTLIFGGLHYFGKPMESVLDGVTVTLLGFFMLFTLRRTGDLWLAVGFHAMFDFAALALFAAPNTGNSGQSVDGHLLDATYHGTAWLTGGACGIEASALILPVIAALFFLCARRYPLVKTRPDDRMA